MVNLNLILLQFWGYGRCNGLDYVSIHVYMASQATRNGISLDD